MIAMGECKDCGQFATENDNLCDDCRERRMKERDEYLASLSERERWLETKDDNRIMSTSRIKKLALPTE